MTRLQSAFTKMLGAKAMREDEIIVMNLCGRGDKDICTVAGKLGAEM